MGGLLKILTIKWVSKRSVGKSQQSRKRQLIPPIRTFFCILMPVLPPTELSNFRPPIGCSHGMRNELHRSLRSGFRSFCVASVAWALKWYFYQVASQKREKRGRLR